MNGKTTIRYESPRELEQGLNERRAGCVNTRPDNQRRLERGTLAVTINTVIARIFQASLSRKEKMSETPRSDFMLRQSIFNEAQNISYYQTCLNAVPHTPENMATVKNYRDAFNKACDHMKSLLVEYEPYGAAGLELAESFDE